MRTPRLHKQLTLASEDRDTPAALVLTCAGLASGRHGCGPADYFRLIALLLPPVEQPGGRQRRTAAYFRIYMLRMLRMLPG